MARTDVGVMGRTRWWGVEPSSRATLKLTNEALRAKILRRLRASPFYIEEAPDLWTFKVRFSEKEGAALPELSESHHEPAKRSRR